MQTHLVFLPPSERLTFILYSQSGGSVAGKGEKFILSLAPSSAAKSGRTPGRVNVRPSSRQRRYRLPLGQVMMACRCPNLRAFTVSSHPAIYRAIA
ncbi:MAG: hypothetical protein KME26_19675 [Oscillatoria princeps RMCB-10]|nr:hypothetical protein [Oscillatoria princeps RMCB-10]